MPFRGRGGRTIVNAGQPRRPMDWECGDLDAVVGDTKFCKWLIPPSELKAGYTDPTLMASMVWGGFYSESPALATVGGFGIIVWSAASDAAPVGDQCPGPLSDCDADWAYSFYGPFVPTPGGAGMALYTNTELDRRSSAKRRLGNDKGILLVAEGEGNVSAHFHVRCLIKE